MPLDPSIFMQGAALRQRQNEQLQQSLMSGLDTGVKMKALKMEQAKAGLDLEKLASGALIKANMGQELTPQDMAALKAFDTLETRKLAVDPTTGNYRKVNASIMDSLPSGAPQGLNLGAFGQGSNPALTQGYADINPVLSRSVLDAEQGDTTGLFFDPTANRQASPQGLNMEAMRPKIEVPQEFEGNPAAAQKYLESAAAEMGKTGTETQMTKESRNKALGEIGSALDALIEDAKGTPSGVLEGGVATLTDKLGKPNSQAIARARFESGKAISGLQTRIAFLKGQGTITDAEAAQAMAFIPNPNDSYEIKLQKLNAGRDYISTLTGSGEKAKSSPVSWEEYFKND